MGRFRDTASEQMEESGVDISPLIDCVFILLIFFIVTTTFVEESGIQADKPQAAAASDSESKSVVFEVREGGAVYYQGRELGVSGVRPTVRQRLRARDAAVIIKADRAASVGRVIRVMDEAKLAGADKVSLSRM